MELLLVFLSTAVGTVVGVGAAMLMMNRRSRVPAVGDAAVRTQLQNTEWALASAGRDVEDLRKQLVEREGVHDELKRTQQQLAAIVADQERQSAERATAEQRATQLAEEAAALRLKLEVGDVSAQRTMELEAALAAAEQRAWDAAEQAAHETARHRGEVEAMSAAAKERATSMSQEISGLATAAASAEQRASDAAAELSSLRERVGQLTAEANATGLDVEESARRIASLEAEVRELNANGAVERERYRLAASDAAQLEGLLRKQRQAAVEAMELLSKAQDKFSGAGAAGSSDVTYAFLHGAAAALDLVPRANGHV